MPDEFIVTIDNPYYPSVEYFETIEEAQVEAAGTIEDHETVEGEKLAKVVIAKIVQVTEIRVDY